MNKANNAIISGDRFLISSDLTNYILRNRETLETPLYVYDEREIERAVERFRKLFPAPVRVFYSLKANPQPGVVRMMAANGAGPELASDGEGRAVNASGVDWGTVLAGGVAKSNSYLRQLAERNPLAVVLDSKAEWGRLAKVMQETNWRPKVLLRISPGETTGGLDMAGESQFGMEAADALTLAAELRNSDTAEFLGLHFYFGSQRLGAEPIRKTLQIAGDTVSVFKSAGCAPKVVDVGLGCGVPYLVRDEDIDRVELAKCIAEELGKENWSGVEFWSEAGRALVATSGLFIARVLECKSLHGKKFALLDGGVNIHNPGIGLGRFFRANPRMAFVTENLNRPNIATDIVGNLCTSADCLARAVNAPDLTEGDLVLIPNSGAYCQTTGFWGFNSQPLCKEAVLTAPGELKFLNPMHNIQLS